MTGVSWRPPPPHRLAGPALRRPVAGGGAGGGGGCRPSTWGWGGRADGGGGKRHPVKVTDSRERWPGGPGRLPGGWQTAPGQWRRPVMSRRSLRKLLFTSGPKLLTLGQILWHYAERAFHEALSEKSVSRGHLALKILTQGHQNCSP